MDWMYFTPERATSFPPLGCYVGDKYKVAPDAAQTLESLHQKLLDEDKTLRTFRRSLGFSHIISKDLVPILLEAKEETDVFLAVVRLLVNFTTPVECLLSLEEVCQSEEGQQTVYELQQHLSETKGLFLDAHIARNVVETIEKFLNKLRDTMDKEVSTTTKSLISDNADSSIKETTSSPAAPILAKARSKVALQCPFETNGIHDCITLLRNILHIPDESASGSTSPSSASSSNEANKRSTGHEVSRQNQILWNLFSGNLDSTILRMIMSPLLSEWCTTLMQLIALVYKDQHVHNLQRLLALWLDTELSDSSESNESNTSPQDQNGSCSSPVLTSAETTDETASSSTDGANHSEKSDKEDSCHADASSTDSGTETTMPSHIKIDDAPSTENMSVLPAGSTIEKKSSAATLPSVSSSSSSLSSSVTAVKRGFESDMEAMALTDEKYVEAPPHKRPRVDFTTKSRSKHLLQSNVAASADAGAGARAGPGGSAAAAGSDSIVKRKEASSQESSSSEMSVPKAKPVTTKVISKLKSAAAAGDGTGSNSESTNISDYGYVSQPMERPVENVSTSSSNDDDNQGAGGATSKLANSRRNVTPHTNLQKPRPKKPQVSAAEKREMRRRKLIKRAKSERMKVKALVQHIPTDDDISDLLKEFTVDFLLKGYSSLVHNLKQQLLGNPTMHLDKSHFLWLITYFLKFASQLEVEMEQIGSVLTVSTICYLTYEGVRSFEDLELASREKTVDLKPHLRRMHLVVTAIHEFIQTVDVYVGFNHFDKTDQKILSRLQNTCGSMKELRQLLLLLIRRFNPSVQSRQYLHDVICCNHTLLVLIEKCSPGEIEVMSKHLTQFASVEVMRQYGLLLETFASNPDSLNDAIFTMMHHISGDLNTPEALYVPQILKSFSDIWEQEDIKLCEDWSDLIEYVIQRFINSMKSNSRACVASLLECSVDNTCSEALNENGFSKSQLDNLYWYYSQCEHTEDPVGGIIEMYKEAYSVTKTRLTVIQALLSQGIITHAQYMGLMYMKSVLSCKPCHEGSVVAEAGSEHSARDSEGGHEMELDQQQEPEHHSMCAVGGINAPQASSSDQVEVLKELLKKQGKSFLLQWLQQILLDTCHVKLNGDSIVTEDGVVLEPIPFHYNYFKQSIPVVPWNKQQESGLQTETFILLLHKLGFHLAADVGKCFPRIPHFWSADHILQLAQKLAPLRAEDINFDISALLAVVENDLAKEEASEAATVTLPSQSSTLSPIVTSFSPMVYSSSMTSPTSDVALSPMLMFGSKEGPSTSQIVTEAMSLFPSAGGNTEGTSRTGFAIPTPTLNWMQMALLSKRLSASAADIHSALSARNSNGAALSSVPSRASPAAQKQVTTTTNSTSTVLSTGIGMSCTPSVTKAPPEGGVVSENSKIEDTPTAPSNIELESSSTSSSSSAHGMGEEERSGRLSAASSADDDPNHRYSLENMQISDENDYEDD